MARVTRPPSLNGLVEVARQLDHATHDLRQLVSWLVVEAHDRGLTWDQIGEAFGVRRQAAHERFGPNSRALRRGEHGRHADGHRSPTARVVLVPVTKTTDAKK